MSDSVEGNWRTSREPGWHKDIGYRLQDVLGQHQYDAGHCRGAGWRLQRNGAPMSGNGARGSAYGAGAPTYDHAELQRHAIEGRLKVAQGIRDRARAAGDERAATKWDTVADELLDKLLEVRGL